MQDIVLIGLNHNTAPVELRECIAFSEDDTRAALARLGDVPVIDEDERVVGLVTQRVRISTPWCVGKTTSTTRISLSSSRTRRGSSPKPADRSVACGHCRTGWMCTFIGKHRPKRRRPRRARRKRRGCRYEEDKKTTAKGAKDTKGL